MPIAKAMDDCFVAYGMNGEPLRPQQGFPLRLMVPGFEGIFHTKYLRRIKVVDRYYMNYNDYGHLDQDSKEAALSYQIGPKSVITFPSGGQQLPGKGFYEISGLAWSGGGAVKLVEVSTEVAGLKSPRSKDCAAHGACPFTTCGLVRQATELLSPGTTRSSFSRRANRSPSTGTSPSMPHSACRGWTTAFNPGGSPRTGA